MEALEEAAGYLKQCSKDASKTEYDAHQTSAKKLLESIELNYDDLPWDIGAWLVPLLLYANPLDEIPLLNSIAEKGNAKELHLIFSEQLSLAAADCDLLLCCQYALLMSKLLPRIKTANLVKFTKPIIISMIDALCLVDEKFFHKLHSNFSDDFDDREKVDIDTDQSLYKTYLTIASAMVDLFGREDDNIEIMELLKDCIVKLVASFLSTIPFELYGSWAEKYKPRLLGRRKTAYGHHLAECPLILHRDELLRLSHLLNLTPTDFTKISTKEQLSMWTISNWSEVTSFQPFLSATDLKQALPALNSILSSNIQNAGMVDLIISIVRVNVQIWTDDRFQHDTIEDLFQLLQSVGTFSATNDSPTMRAFSNDLYATIITSLHDSQSLIFIKDVLERCPFDNLRAATIDVLKTCFAQEMAKEGTVYSTPLAWIEVSDLLYKIRFSNMEEFSSNAMSILQTLNLVYFLMAADKNDKTGIKTSQAIRKRDFIGPLRRAIDGWMNNDNSEEQADELVNELIKTRILLDMLDAV